MSFNQGDEWDDPMMENNDADKAFCMDRSNDDSLRPNFEEHQDLNNDLKDLLDNNYEDNFPLPDINNMVSKASFDDKNKEFYLQAERVLTTRDHDAEYVQMLNKILFDSERLTEERAVGLMVHIMGVNSAVKGEQFYLVRVLLFLKGLWDKLGGTTQPQLYLKVLEEILNQKHSFYNIRIPQEVSQMLQIYLPDEGEVEDEDNLQLILMSIFGDHFQQDGQQPIPVEDMLYQFVHRKFASRCYRGDITKVKLNMMLASRAPDARTRHQLIEQWEDGLLITDYAEVDKKVLESYLTEIIGLTCDEPTLAVRYIFKPIEWLLKQEQQMDRKILGLRLVGMGVEMARERDKAGWSDQLATWMQNEQLVDNYMRQSTHSRIMQQMPLILRFLYDHGALSAQFMSQVIRSSLHSQDLFRVVQSMLSWLRLEHVEEAFEVVTNHLDRQSPLFGQFLIALTSSNALHPTSSKRKRNVILQDNRREPFTEIQEENQLPGPAEGLVKRLLLFLIELVSLDQATFMPPLLRLVSSHLRLLRGQLEPQIISLLRNNSPCAVWILEHCLKVESCNDRSQGKYELVTRLAAEGVFQLILALLARHRFSKALVEKALAVVILFCRLHKPLQRPATEFLWKVLGTYARDEKEREQFFVFLKDLVRFQGTVSEDSANFIFFEIMMGLSAEWFSLRVYDCLQMLFLRLNEDCRLLLFDKDKYQVTEPPLIGVGKFWYIFFNTPDLKVSKKARDLMHRLILHAGATKQRLLQDALRNLVRHLETALTLKPQYHLKQQVLINRGFELAQKLVFQAQRQQEQGRDGPITLQIKDSTEGSISLESKAMEFTEKLTLSDLRCFVADNLNPPRKASEIQLWNKGKLLKGEKLSLRELKIDNGESITVMMVSDVPLPPREQVRQQQMEQLRQMMGEVCSEEFLGFIVDKFEGQNIDTIAIHMLDPDKMEQLEAEFKGKKMEEEDVLAMVPEKEEEQTQKKFGELLAEKSEHIQLLLQCIRNMTNKKAGWALLKKLPLNQHYVGQVQGYIERGEWGGLFADKSEEQKLYLMHVLTNYARQSPAKMTFLFETQKLRNYLIDSLTDTVTNAPQALSQYEQSLRLLLLSMNCSIFGQLQSYISLKQKDDDSLLDNLDKWMSEEMQEERQHYISGQLCEKLINCLLIGESMQRVAISVVKVYLHHLQWPASTRHFSMLKHSNILELLRKYGSPFVFAVSMTALRHQKQAQQNPNTAKAHMASLALQLLSSSRLMSITQEDRHTKAIFHAIEILLTISEVEEPDLEIEALEDIMGHLQSRIEETPQAEIVGLCKVGTRLMLRHLKTEHGQRRNDSLCKGAVWMFKNYLFGLEQPLPSFKSKQVRNAAYRLLLSLSGYSGISQKVVEEVKVLMAGFKASPREEGDFRNSQFIGIRNLGATCYINSLMQQLFHTALPKLLLEPHSKDSGESIKLLELKKIFASLYKGVRSPVSPKEYVSTVRINGEEVRTHVQQDANEYFASLMHDIEEAQGAKVLAQSVSGTLCHEIKGLEEGAETKVVQEKFLTMMVEMRGKRGLHEGLAGLVKPHLLEGDNMYYSEFLGRKIRASSKIFLEQLPNLLVITLKRFYWNYETLLRSKINDYFEFPQDLDLSRYSLQPPPQPNEYYQYRLCGILIHSGSAQSGHYYSFIRVADRWLEFNDRRVTEWDIGTNLKSDCFGGSDERSRNAYMLFYQRVDSGFHGSQLDTLPNDNPLLVHVAKYNQQFIRNKLIYDSKYIDFVKELSTFPNCKSVLDVLDSLHLSHHSTVEQPFIGPLLPGNDMAMVDEGNNAQTKEQGTEMLIEFEPTVLHPPPITEEEKRLRQMVLDNLNL